MDKSAANICLQMAEWVPDLFCNIHSVKNHKSVNNAANTEAREKISRRLEFLEF